LFERYIQQLAHNWLIIGSIGSVGTAFCLKGIYNLLKGLHKKGMVGTAFCLKGIYNG